MPWASIQEACAHGKTKSLVDLQETGRGRETTHLVSQQLAAGAVDCLSTCVVGNLQTQEGL